MEGGGGGDPIGDFIEDLTEDPVNTLANAAVNYTTFGLVGYENGKLTKGGTINALDEGIGELTGRNAARKTQMETKDAVQAERVARNQQIKDENAAKGRRAVSASKYAASVRNSSTAVQNNTLGNASSSLTKDFLGT